MRHPAARPSLTTSYGARSLLFLVVLLLLAGPTLVHCGSPSRPEIGGSPEANPMTDPPEPTGSTAPGDATDTESGSSPPLSAGAPSVVSAPSAGERPTSIGLTDAERARLVRDQGNRRVWLPFEPSHTYLASPIVGVVSASSLAPAPASLLLAAQPGPTTTEPNDGSPDAPSPDRDRDATDGAPPATATADDAPAVGSDPDVANPAVVTIDGVTLRADAFASRLFHMHFDWFQHFLREMFVEELSKLEATAEGIVFTDAEIEAAHTRFIAFLREQARQTGQFWELHWRDLGFASEQDYVTALRSHVARMMRLEHLVVLQRLRLDKVTFSMITMPAAPDRITPDPEGRARRIAARIREGELTWAAAVRRYSSSVDNRAREGLIGTITRGLLGVQPLEDWLFTSTTGAVSDPISHPLHGWVVARVDDIDQGVPDLTYADAKPEIESLLAGDDPSGGVVGARITPRTTFIWLDRVLRRDETDVVSYGPLSPDGPWIALIEGQPLTAGDLLAHALQSNPDWARLVISEVIVFYLAGLEGAREGMELDDERVAHAADQVLGYLQDATAARGESFELIWRREGYVSVDAFRDAVIMPIARESLLVERLVVLHDMRQEQRLLDHVLLPSEQAAGRIGPLLTPENFADQARRYSQHRATANVGGRVGWVTPDLYDHTFSTAVFDLDLGVVSDPIESAFGWHLVLVREVRPARPDVTWEEAREEIDRSLGATEGVPGRRITAADTYRWIAAVRRTERYEIEIHVEATENEPPASPSDSDG